MSKANINENAYSIHIDCKDGRTVDRFNEIYKLAETFETKNGGELTQENFLVMLLDIFQENYPVIF